MITDTEMRQLFHAIVNMAAVNIGGTYMISQEAVLTMLTTYTDGCRVEKTKEGYRLFKPDNAIKE